MPLPDEGPGGTGTIDPSPRMALPASSEARRGGVMRRRAFDWLMSTGGVVVTVFLIVAGVLLFAGYKFADNNVHTQLAAQKIFFPPAGGAGVPSLPPADRAEIEKYAGQQLV